jgi:hypothetical protein
MSWQSVTLNERRGLWLLSLTVGLAATVSFHYYGVLILFPLVLGELFRSVTLKRIDIPVWVTFALGMSPLLLFLPLIHQALTQSGSFWSRAHWGAIPTFYSDLLGPAVVPIIAALVAWSAYPASRLSGASSTREPFVARLPGFELAAAFGFILIPVLAVILGKLVTGAFTSRYALPAIIGFSILIAFSAFRLWRSSEPMMVILVLCFCAAFASKVAKTWKDLGWDIAKEQDAESFLQSHTGEALPIVVSDAHLFSLLGHYAPPDLAQRLVYLADPGASRRYLGFDSQEQGMVHLLQPWFHWRVEDYEPYIASHQRFLVYGPVGTGGASITNSGYFLNWVLSDLVARHMQVELKARNEEILLFLISPNQPDSR